MKKPIIMLVTLALLAGCRPTPSISEGFSEVASSSITSTTMADSSLSVSEDTPPSSVIEESSVITPSSEQPTTSTSTPSSSEPPTTSTSTPISSETPSTEPMEVFLVTFVTNAPTTIAPLITNYLASPPLITNEPYVLEAWYFDAAFTNIVVFPYQVTHDITLYAHWVESSPGLNYALNNTGTGYVIESYSGNAYQVLIPAYINSLPVVEIGAYAFYENGAVTSVLLPETLTKIGYAAFKNMPGLMSIELPTSLRIIASDAFSGAVKLTTINFAETALEEIGANAFENTKLTGITLPSTIKELGARTFANVTTLHSVTILATTPPVCFHSTFDNANLTLKIYVPASALNAYLASPYWKSYWQIINAI